MFIQTESTPNPQTLKFMPGVTVLERGTRNYTNIEEALRSPLAITLFRVSGVKGVFFGHDFITVTKTEEQSWDTIKTLVLAAMVDHFMAGLPIIDEEKISAESSVEMDDITKQIFEIIETKVRPAVAQDGGDITFKQFKDGIVYVELHGACSGCPSSSITLKSGIENMLKHYVPEVQAVEQI